jgi:predicted RNA binding protein YcfA (HicA-like mRNA interferase family)
VRLPRDLSGTDLIKALRRLGYDVTRQRGSHVRLTATVGEREHHVTVPDHDALKAGTLNTILKDVAAHAGRSRDELIETLFR